MQLIADCSVIKYEEEQKQRRDNLPDDDFNKHYPFDSRNVEEFAHFCLQSGGFEIC